MKLSDAKSEGIFRVRVPVGEYFNKEEEEEWIELREPSVTESRSLSQAGEDEDQTISSVSAVFRSCLINSSFEPDEPGGNISCGDLYELLEQSASMYTKVLTRWQSAIPLPETTVPDSPE